MNHTRNYGDFKPMSDKIPPTLVEGQTWRSYEKKVLEWLRMSTVPPHKTTAAIVGPGLERRQIIKGLAEKISKDFSYLDKFSVEDLPSGWILENWTIQNKWKVYTPGREELEPVKYQALWDKVDIEKKYKATRAFLNHMRETQRLGTLQEKLRRLRFLVR